MQAADARPDSTAAHALAERLRENVESVVYGKAREVGLVVAALACRGHVLIEDVPGTAKTVLARALAQSVEAAIAGRIQCTPDLQPTDVTGLAVFDQRSREFEFRPGPVFANVLLVDEINRAVPKTQSALLEAMAERQVTSDGVTRPLPDPFLVIATENPVEYEGTFPLPEAQLDRFFLRTSLGYPDLDSEISVLENQLHGHPLEQLRPVVSAGEIGSLQEAVEHVYLDDEIRRWLVELVRATRSLEQLELGASVRASLALDRGARAWALLDGRSYVVPADVEELFGPVVGHRVLLAPAAIAEVGELARDELVAEVLRRCLELAPPPDVEPQPVAASATRGR
jgi:MoxR-like ATPase